MGSASSSSVCARLTPQVLGPIHLHLHLHYSPSPSHSLFFPFFFFLLLCFIDKIVVSCTLCLSVPPFYSLSFFLTEPWKETWNLLVSDRAGLSLEQSHQFISQVPIPTTNHVFPTACQILATCLFCFSIYWLVLVAAGHTSAFHINIVTKQSTRPWLNSRLRSHLSYPHVDAV